VTEQVADRDGTISGNGVVCPVASGVKRFLRHAHLSELRQVLRYRVGQRKLAFFVKNHGGNACDGLCHRVHTHDGVGLIGPPSLTEDDLTVPRDEAGSTVQPTSGDVFLHHGVNPVQAIPGEAHLLRSRGRQTRADDQRCHQTEDEKNPHERKSTTEAGSASAPRTQTSYASTRPRECYITKLKIPPGKSQAEWRRSGALSTKSPE